MLPDHDDTEGDEALFNLKMRAFEYYMLEHPHIQDCDACREDLQKVIDQTLGDYLKARIKLPRRITGDPLLEILQRTFDEKTDDTPAS